MPSHMHIHIHIHNRQNLPDILRFLPVMCMAVCDCVFLSH